MIDSRAFKFVLAPTVVAELDELKRLRAAQPVGVCAEKAIRVVKDGASKVRSSRA